MEQNGGVAMTSQKRSDTDFVEPTPLAAKDIKAFESQKPSTCKSSILMRLFPSGLTTSLRLGAVIATLVLLTNFVWLGYALSKYGIKNGYGAIRQDSCEAVKQLDIWLHLLINVLSTSLQTATNM